jgi:hypothetical protein
MSHKDFKDRIESAERVPHTDVWERIEKQLDLLDQPIHQGPAPKRWPLVWVVLSLVLVSLLFFFNHNSSQPQELKEGSNSEEIPLLAPNKELGIGNTQLDPPPIEPIHTSPNPNKQGLSDPTDHPKKLETEKRKTPTKEDNFMPDPKEEILSPRSSHPPMAMLPQRPLDPLSQMESNVEIYTNLIALDYNQRLHNRGIGAQYFNPTQGISLLSFVKEHELIQDLNQTIQKIKSIETVVIKY